MSSKPTQIPAVSVWTPKGGVAKTTLTLNLAGCFAADGLRVVVVDLDPQAGARRWFRLAEQQGRDVPFVVEADPKRAKAYPADLVIYDHPPNVCERLPGDLVAMPTLLDASSMLLFMHGLALVAGQMKPILPVPARVRTDRGEQRAVLAEYFAGAACMRDRAVYPHAFGRGTTVFDPAVTLSGVQQARAEVRGIADAVAGMLGLAPRVQQQAAA